MTKCTDPDKLGRMVREISAGGVVVRKGPAGWEIAAIEPQKEPTAGVKTAKKRSQKVLLALPKGLVDPGEKPDQTAIREVREETGLIATPITKLSDIKYVYVRSWGDKQRVFKIVSFYLLKYQSGDIDEIDSAMRVEVKRALWIPLEDAGLKLAYRGERDVIRRAQEYLKNHSEV
jgi:8-oxo-dGTP pyrophosphatase MutT (NUDIX family)